MFNTAWKRMLFVSLVWIVFGLGSGLIYMIFIHDVSGTFWIAGTFALPVVVPLIWLIDRLLNKNELLRSNPGVVATIDCSFALSFWFVPGGVVVLIGLLITSIF